jgi:hypothetical protein
VSNLSRRTRKIWLRCPYCHGIVATYAYFVDDEGAECAFFRHGSEQMGAQPYKARYSRLRYRCPRKRCGREITLLADRVWAAVIEKGRAGDRNLDLAALA